MAPKNIKAIVTLATYLLLLVILTNHKAFSMARWNILPSVVVEGYYRKTPMAEGVGPRGAGKVELNEHI